MWTRVRPCLVVEAVVALLSHQMRRVGTLRERERERRVSVCEEAPGFRPGPRGTLRHTLQSKQQTLQAGHRIVVSRAKMLELYRLVCSLETTDLGW